MRLHGATSRTPVRPRAGLALVVAFVVGAALPACGGPPDSGTLTPGSPATIDVQPAAEQTAAHDDTPAPEPEPVDDPFAIGAWVAEGDLQVEGGETVAAVAWIALAPNFVVEPDGSAFGVSLLPFTWHLRAERTQEELSALAAFLSDVRLSHLWPESSGICSAQRAVKSADFELGLVAVGAESASENYCELRFNSTVTSSTESDRGTTVFDFTVGGPVLDGLDSNAAAQALVDELVEPPVIVVVAPVASPTIDCPAGSLRPLLVLEGVLDSCIAPQG